MSDPSRGKRKLPVLNSSEPAEEPRPPWQWVAIGTVCTFLAWLPLAALVNWMLSRVVQPDDAGIFAIVLASGNALVFASAAAASGALVGRFGGKAAAHEAALGGLIAGSVAWAVAIARGPAPIGWIAIVGWAGLLAVLGLVGGGSALIGGRAGVRWRDRK